MIGIFRDLAFIQHSVIMMNNKILLTVIVVLVLAFGVGALLFAFNDQGVSAEIVDVQVNPDALR